MTKNFNYFCVSDKEHKNSKDFVVTKDSSEEDDPEICPECGEELKCLGFIPAWGIGKFSMLPKSGKTKMLKERSKTHAKKHLAEKKREMIKQCDKQMLND